MVTPTIARGREVRAVEGRAEVAVEARATVARLEAAIGREPREIGAFAKLNDHLKNKINRQLFSSWWISHTFIIDFVLSMIVPTIWRDNQQCYTATSTYIHKCYPLFIIPIYIHAWENFLLCVRNKIFTVIRRESVSDFVSQLWFRVLQLKSILKLSTRGARIFLRIVGYSVNATAISTRWKDINYSQ